MQRGLQDASVDVIYKQFVDARVAEAEPPTPTFDDREPEPEPEPQQVDDDDFDDEDYEDDETTGEEYDQLPTMLTQATQVRRMTKG